MNLTRRTLLGQAGIAISASAFSQAGAAGSPAAPPLPDVLLPYLQHPAPDAMSICILARNIEAATAVLTDEDGSGPRTVPAAPRAVPGTPWTLWKARLTALEPGGRYRYRVRTVRGSAEDSTEPRAFRTLDPRAASMKAAIFNDIHDRLPTLESLLSHIRPDDFDFTIFNGDMINDPSAANGAEVVIRLWNDYVRLLDGSSKPILFVRGNHEVRGSFRKSLGFLFDLPFLEADAPEADQQWHYALNAGPVHFLMMDTGEDDSPATDPTSYKRPRFWEAYRRRQTAWLDEHLATASVRDADYRVFVSHIPLHNPAGWYSIVSRDEWSARVAEAGFDVMLAGHDHAWKFLPANRPFTIRKGPETDTAPIPVIIGGGPSLKEGTVILLHADAEGLRTRMIAADGGVMLHAWSRGPVGTAASPG